NPISYASKDDDLSFHYERVKAPQSGSILHKTGFMTPGRQGRIESVQLFPLSAALTGLFLRLFVEGMIQVATAPGSGWAGMMVQTRRLSSLAAPVGCAFCLH